jgi:hypothetical protein
MFVIGSVSKLRKWEAEEILRKTVESKVGPVQEQRMDPATTFGWFIENRFVPTRSGGWGEATKNTNIYDLKHYIVPVFGSRALGSITEDDLQMFLNRLAVQGYSESILKHCYALLKSVFKMARKRKFVCDNPAEELFMPITKPVKRPTSTPEYIRALYEAIEDPRDHALMCAGLFCAPRTSEAFGLTWKAYRGDHFVFSDTAWEGKLQEGVMKTDASFAMVYIPEQIRWSFERWRAVCPDTMPDALMFPTTRVGKSRVPVPMRPKNFMKGRIWPIADKLGIPRKMVTFQVMRRTLATDLQDFGTLKDAQAALRHKNPSITAGSTCSRSTRASHRRSMRERLRSSQLHGSHLYRQKFRSRRHPPTQSQNELLSIAKCGPESEVRKS